MSVIAFPTPAGRAGTLRHRRGLVASRSGPAGKPGSNIVILPVIRIERHMDIPAPRLPDLDAGTRKPGSRRH